ncbi:MAG: HPr family phosphocarrier protein [Anaerolineales bacterium]|nr:HPr family phosphocarrier protein [Anaerolineales bacterium]
MPNKLGIHARPAARLVSLAGQFDAQIELAHAGNSAVATSMNQVATLGVRQGDAGGACASGPQASDALAAIEMLALDNFGDPIAVTEPTEIIAAAMEDVAGDTLVGIPAAGGIAFGPAVLYRPEAIEVAERTTSDPDAERTRLEVAIAAVASHLAYLRNEMFQRAGAGEAGIFDAQLFMVQDADLQQTAIQAIEMRHLDASSAWLQAMTATAARYRALDDPFTRAGLMTWSMWANVCCAFWKD